jgi:hypothetical protein
MILTKELAILSSRDWAKPIRSPSRGLSYAMSKRVRGAMLLENLETCDTLDPRLGTAHRSSAALGFINVSSFVRSPRPCESLAPPN